MYVCAFACVCVCVCLRVYMFHTCDLWWSTGSRVILEGDVEKQGKLSFASRYMYLVRMSGRTDGRTEIND